MALTPEAVTRIEEYGEVVAGISPAELTRHVGADSYSPLRDDRLSLVNEGKFRAFYAPFDWVNHAADVVILGVTPGKQQALEALSKLRSGRLAGQSVEECARDAKEAASFKGTMRTLGARLMDHFDLHRVFGLKSTLDLFGSASTRAHYTSVLRYPVMKDFKNYSGDARILNVDFMRRMIHNYLAPELALLPNAWLVPFGPTAHKALDYLVGQGSLDSSRILGGILHPGGQQWNRYNVQLGLVDQSVAATVAGGPEVLRRSDALRRQVQQILSAKV